MVTVGQSNGEQPTGVSSSNRTIRLSGVERTSLRLSSSADNSVSGLRAGKTNMTSEKFEGTIEQAYGKAVSPSVNFEGEYTKYDNIEEIRTANDFPSNDDVVNFVNAKRKANARQKAMQAALDAAGYEKPTLENDEDLQVKTIVKALLARKNADGTPVHTQDSAEKAARATLGIA